MIDRKTGESNLTQIYLMVSRGSSVLSKAVSVSDDTLSVELSMSGTALSFHSCLCKAINRREYNIIVHQSGKLSLPHQNIKAQEHKSSI